MTSYEFYHPNIRSWKGFRSQAWFWFCEIWLQGDTFPYRSILPVQSRTLDFYRVNLEKKLLRVHSHAGGWSLRIPKAIKSFLWETVSLKGLHIFPYYFTFLLKPIIEIKIFEKQYMALKNCSQWPIGMKYKYRWLCFENVSI